VAASERGIVATSFDERGFLQDLTTHGHEAVVHGAPEEATRLAADARTQLAGYFNGATTQFDVPIDLGVQTEFSQAVLEEVARLPFGQTATYAEIGERAGRARAARAVGNILATCPYTVIMPCHRVIHGSRTPEERTSQSVSKANRKGWLLRFELEVLAGK